MSSGSKAERIAPKITKQHTQCAACSPNQIAEPDLSGSGLRILEARGVLANAAALPV
jgi:hypothetical protein